MSAPVVRHQSFFGISSPARPVALQDEDELARFIALLKARQVRSYLEIGARYGGTFERVMRALPVGSTGVAIDFPGGDFGDERSPEDLIAAARRLRELGQDIRLLFGPSDAPEILRRALPPYGARYDAILIDGDHSYAGVRGDWETYGLLGRLVAFHDIAAPQGFANRHGCRVEVARLWAELKAGRPHLEIVSPDNNTPMGIGVIINEEGP